MGKYNHLWKLGKDGGDPEERGLFRWMLFTTVCFILFIVVFKHDGLFRYMENLGTTRRQRTEIRNLQREIDRESQFLNSLKTDRDSLEKFAREKFLFCKPGEDVYVYKERK